MLIMIKNGTQLSCYSIAAGRCFMKNLINSCAIKIWILFKISIITIIRLILVKTKRQNSTLNISVGQHKNSKRVPVYYYYNYYKANFSKSLLNRLQNSKTALTLDFVYVPKQITKYTIRIFRFMPER